MDKMYAKIWRKLKFYTYTNTKKSESTMIKNLSRILGSPEDTVVYIGDWDQHGKYLRGMGNHLSDVDYGRC